MTHYSRGVGSPTVNYIVYKNVVLLDNNHLASYPLVQQRLRELASDCDSQYHTCGVYYKDKCPNSITVMSLGRVDALLAGEHLDSQANIITGYLIGVFSVGSDSIELYDMCIDKRVRGQPIAKTLLEAVIDMQHKLSLPESRIWTSIDVENPDFERLLRVVSQVGFRSPAFYRETPTALDIKFSYPIIGFIYHPSQKLTDPEAVYVETMALKNTLRNECLVQLSISSDLAQHLFKYTLKQVEYTGELFVSGYHNGVGVLAADKDKIFKGDPAPKYTAYISPNTLSFHTHPAICNTSFKCYVIRPTVDDLILAITGYIAVRNPMYLHLVVTTKGIYFIGLTLRFQNELLALSNDEKENVVRKIRAVFIPTQLPVQPVVQPVVLTAPPYEGEDEDYFGPPESPSQPPPSQPPQQSISSSSQSELSYASDDLLFYNPLVPETEEEFMNRVLTLTYDNVMGEKEGEERDYKLFNIDFIAKDVFDSETLIGHFAYYGKCPIDVTHIPASRIVV